MSISTSSEYRLLRRSHSLPHLFASRHDSGASGITATTNTATGSCSLLDHIDYESALCHEHQFNNQTRHYNKATKYNHNYRHHNYHQQYETMSYDTRLVADLRQLLTLRQHYYPEGGWGYIVLTITVIVQCISHGVHMSSGILISAIISRFHENLLTAGLIGSLSMTVSLIVSPVTITFCRRKSTRLLAVIGGLVLTLGCLFTSFAQQYHQVLFSYGIVVGLGVGITRDCTIVMIAQYFKKKREFVEIFTVAGSGLGILVMSTFLQKSIDALSWRYGLQCVTLTVISTFFLALFYRSAALYHPQRRAILHLKTQKRKVKEKNRHNNRAPFFDLKTLRSQTVRIILLSSACSAFGIYIPFVHLAQTVKNDKLLDAELPLQTNMGLAWILGAMVFGVLVTQRNNAECRIARQYLCQVSLFMLAICLLALTKIQANYEGYFIIVWTYGFFCGGYHYSLRVYLFERVRARNFSQAWSFVQCSQSIPIVVGVNLAEFLNCHVSHRSGYLFGFFCALSGSMLLFLVDVHKRSISSHRHTRSNGISQLCKLKDCPENRKLSFTQEPDNEPARNFNVGNLLLHSDVLGNQISEEFVVEPNASGNVVVPLDPVTDKPELTCISEEGIADMDLPDNIFDDFDYIGDCITSCNKVEQYLMLSEFENNINAERPSTDKKRHKCTVEHET